MSRAPRPVFDAVVRIDKLPAGGRTLDVEADAAERAAIAEAMRILSVEHFEAHLSVVPFRGGLRARGTLRARATQESVVSFAPVSQDIAEDIDRVFLPAPRDKQAHAPNAEIYIDLDDDDFPDHIDGPEVDLSALLLETLALALDPYPRGADETLETPADAEEDTGPFAALARLRNDDGDKN